MLNPIFSAGVFLIALAEAASAQSALPEAIAAPGEAMVLATHAEGAQIYECKANGDAAPTWVFREPIATLLRGDQTIGRHFAGPSWELDDSSVVKGEVVGKAPGASPADIPWLKLTVTAHRGAGELADVTTVQRINTNSGALAGPCEKNGATRAVAYSADYVFLRKK